ncbi:MAG: methyltransferase domain-containing protein [Nevskiales bacterium]
MSEIEYQRKLLGDGVRNQAFHAALQRVIVPGETTLVDVGAGTGFLSFLALTLGAQHCTLIEYSDTLKLAQDIARRNRLSKLSFIQKHSTEVKKLARSDVVLSETLGNYALEENLIETLNDAQRFLKPGGVVIPGAVQQFVAPVISGRLQKELDVWPRVGFGLDLAPARQVALNNMYVKSVMPADIGGDTEVARCWDRLLFAADQEAPASLRQSRQSWSSDELRARGAQQVYGYVLWWEAELVPGIRLSTSPFAPATHWEQVYLPLLDAVALGPKQQIELTLKSDTRAAVCVTWHTRLLSGVQCLQDVKQDMAKGRL